MRQGASAEEAGDSALVARLKAGDEGAFAELVETHQAAMVRVAELFVPSRSVAEEVAQEAWVGVLSGLESFEGRSSLKTWMFRILTNRAKTRGARERRTVPMSALERPDVEGAGAAVDEDRFHPDEDPARGNLWAQPPRPPDVETIAGEGHERLLAAIEKLPPAQRAVITLRDVQGFDSESVCDLLEVSAANQRVLLHRGRSAVRSGFERYLEGDDR
ncbi:MAG: RNA polymerase sigma factor [Thermoleophilaceae bacterium]